MSDREAERGKFYGKKKYNHRNDRNDQKLFGRNNRTLFKGDKEGKEQDAENKAKMKQPQILIKAREKVEDHSMSPKHVAKDKEEITVPKEMLTTNLSDVQLFHNAKRMHKAVKLLDDGILYNDNLQDYMNETSDFLVVGIIGSQGVGKSTIMNLLASDKKHSAFKKKGHGNDAKKSVTGLKSAFDEFNTNAVFKQQAFDDYESCVHVTSGIDMFVTENRMILLDCQPFTSSSVMDELIHNEMKRSNLLGDYSTIENIGELQGLQHIAFLMSVCHVVIFAQDFVIDTNNVRFVLTAEMLKPSTTNNEEEYLEQFPHMFILHNKAQLEDFLPSRFKQIQQTYRLMFRASKLHLETSMGLGTGKVIPTLNASNCGPPINLFMLPDSDHYEESMYQGYPPLGQLIQSLRRNVCSVTKFPLSHVPLTEKTWLTYCTKVWDHVKKSSFYVEYGKVLP